MFFLFYFFLGRGWPTPSPEKTFLGNFNSEAEHKVLRPPKKKFQGHGGCRPTFGALGPIGGARWGPWDPFGGARRPWRPKADIMEAEGRLNGGLGAEPPGKKSKKVCASSAKTDT